MNTIPIVSILIWDTNGKNPQGFNCKSIRSSGVGSNELVLNLVDGRSVNLNTSNRPFDISARELDGRTLQPILVG